MGISQQIGASSLSKPGVCTSSTRPATPYEGQMIYETDTDKVLVWNGSAWYANWNTAWGIVGYQENSTDTGSQAASYSQTVATVTFTAVANRYYRLTYYESTLVQVTSPGYLYLKIMDGATIVNSSSVNPGTFSDGLVSVVKTFTAGSVTITAVLLVVTNNCRALRTSAERAYLLVEDIGPV